MSTLAIAVQGIGFGAGSVARQGFWGASTRPAILPGADDDYSSARTGRNTYTDRDDEEMLSIAVGLIMSGALTCH